MPSTLLEHQFELAPVDGDGLVFGTEDTGYLTTTRPQIVSGELRTNDIPRPGEDGLMTSRDYVGGDLYTFEMGVLTDVNNLVLAPGSPAEAYAMNLDYLGVLKGWWRDPLWRSTARSMAMLRTCQAGRTSRCYGRPRRYDEVTGFLTRVGYSTVVCDFQLIDNRFYSDEEYSTEIGLAQPPDGGLVAPLVAPLTTTPESRTEGVATITGNTPTWLVVEFHGPVTNPSISIGDLTIGLTGTLAYDEVITVDPRPWARTALRNTDGASFAGLLSRETPAMKNMLIAPGTYGLLYRGLDPSGSSTARIRWRNARNRP